MTVIFRIPFHFESVLRFVADRLAPSVSEQLTERGSLSALLVAFDINRQALRESRKSPTTDIEFLNLPVQAIEDLICYLHRKDAQRNSEPRKRNAFEALPETPPFCY